MERQHWATFCCRNPFGRVKHSSQKKNLRPVYWLSFTSVQWTGMSEESFSYDANVLGDWASTQKCKKWLQWEDKENINLLTEFDSDPHNQHPPSPVKYSANSCSILLPFSKICLLCSSVVLGCADLKRRERELPSPAFLLFKMQYSIQQKKVMQSSNCSKLKLFMNYTVVCGLPNVPLYTCTVSLWRFVKSWHNPWCLQTMLVNVNN